ncbi:MAG: hypothetical protein R3F33_13995 [Planctomycetota bacterium]
MAPLPALSDSEFNEYARALLDPGMLGNAPACMALRTRFLHPDQTPAESTFVPESEDREHCEEQLQAARSEFFDGPAERLELRLAEPDLTHHPDLERYRARLQRAAAVRSDLEAAAKDSAIHSRQWQSICDALLAPASESAALKSQILSQAGGKSARFNKGLRNRLARHYPDVYALDPEWFDRLGKSPKIKKDSASPKVSWILIAFWAVYVLLKLGRYLFR